MRITAPLIAASLLLAQGLLAAADVPYVSDAPVIQPVGATFRFSDEEPPWEPSDTAMMTPAGADQPTMVCHTCCQPDRLLGLIAPTDGCFGDFISPMTNPVYFEDPRTLTEARFIYLRHKVPTTALGEEVNLVAMQLRAALTSRLSIIATKDGFISSSNPLIEDGWLDVNVGLKFNLLSNPAMQRLLSVGVTYELPVGSRRTQQGSGDGLFHLFATGGTQLGKGHWITAAGLLLPADRTEESSFCYWSNHLDYRLGCSSFYLLSEVNWFHWMGSGQAFPLPIEGGDLFNLGSIGVSGNDIVTGAVGVKFRPSHRLEVGAAIEAPLTQRRDVLDNRLTIDCILRY